MNYLLEKLQKIWIAPLNSLLLVIILVSLGKTIELGKLKDILYYLETD